MTIKEIFDNAQDGTLTLDQFTAAATEGGAKFVDLSDGGYVSQHKYQAELDAKDSQIADANTSLKERDKDLKALQAKLADAGTDAEKLATLSTDFETLQTKYDTDTKALQAKLSKQAYEFAVREFAATQEFTSNAAKRDFIASMIEAELKIGKNGKITGAEDFVKEYSEDNADAFVVADAGSDDNGAGNDDSAEPQGAGTSGGFFPQFAGPTPGANESSNDNGAAFGFSFTPIRPLPNNN